LLDDSSKFLLDLPLILLENLNNSKNQNSNNEDSSDSNEVEHILQQTERLKSCRLVLLLGHLLLFAECLVFNKVFHADPLQHHFWFNHLELGNLSKCLQENIKVGRYIYLVDGHVYNDLEGADQHPELVFLLVEENGSCELDNKNGFERALLKLGLLDQLLFDNTLRKLLRYSSLHSQVFHIMQMEVEARLLRFEVAWFKDLHGYNIPRGGRRDG